MLYPENIVFIPLFLVIDTNETFNSSYSRPFHGFNCKIYYRLYLNITSKPDFRVSPWEIVL